jgi:hypothetical protein
MINRDDDESTLSELLAEALDALSSVRPTSNFDPTGYVLTPLRRGAEHSDKISDDAFKVGAVNVAPGVKHGEAPLTHEGVDRPCGQLLDEIVGAVGTTFVTSGLPAK